MGERCVRNAEVEGSTPFRSTYRKSIADKPFEFTYKRLAVQLASTESTHWVTFLRIERVACLPSCQKYTDFVVRERKLAPTVLIAGYLGHLIARHSGKRTGEAVHCKLCNLLRQSHGHTLVKDFDLEAYQFVRRAMIDKNWSRWFISDQCQRIRRLDAWGRRKSCPRESGSPWMRVPAKAERVK